MNNGKSVDKNGKRLSRPDDAAFSQIADKYSPYIRAVASAFPEHLREDLIQEGLLALSDASRTFDSEKNVPIEAYIKICIKRRIKDAYFGLVKDGEKVDIDIDNVIDPNDIEARIVEKEYTEDFFRKLRSSLTDLEKNVLSEYLADKTYAQISEDLSISEKAVDNTLSRIRSKIKKQFLI
ncbi:MAG: sigma-70 family RNA polymerase sigma factor [Clostridia bacterium]|nr:sigma-70 family RNA polymerase sigma factor [Clostridia bacterium]